MYKHHVYSDELCHYGVKGMKWGVRRYRNYDGSYTQAGVKRFDKSLSDYEKAHDRYTKAKKNPDIDNADLVNARVANRKAKNRLEKDYRHLKQDKLADKGKDLYSRGKTIGYNSQITHVLNRVGGISISAALYNKQTNRLGDDKVTKMLATVGEASLGISGAKRLYDEVQARKLRAYYSHTSNY